MHMADALLSPQVGGVFWAGTLGAIAYAAKKLRENLDDRLIPLMGVLGAFIFAGQIVNFTIPGTGSSGHIGGGMLLSILLGPYAAFLVIASVLTIQSLFFADGGLLALGSNIWNLGIYPCFIAYPLIYRVIVRNSKTRQRITIASVIGSIVALELGAFSVVLQTTFSGITELPFGAFAALMLAIHLPIAVVEGLITAGIVNYVKTIRPDIVEDAGSMRAHFSGIPLKKVVIAVAALTLLTGGIFSWFASNHPDGLEWAIERIYGKSEFGGKTGLLTEKLSGVQKKITVMPDYNFPSKVNEQASPAGASISGLLGSVMVLALVFLIGLGIKTAKRFRHRQ